MILERTVYVTSSGKRKRRGSEDTARLVSETPEEARKLAEAEKHGRLTQFRGSAHLDTLLRDLENTARAIDPKFKVQTKRIPL